MSVEDIKIIAVIFSIVGSGILAFRVTGILSALSLVANIHEVNIQQLMSDNQARDIYNIGNSTAHVERAQKRCLLITGFVCIILPGVLRFVALVISNA